MKKLTLRTIEREVCRYYECAPSEMWLKTRVSKVLIKRQLFHYFAYKYSKHNYSEIGSYKSKNYGRVTVMNSCKSIQDRIDTDKNFLIDYNNIKDVLSKLRKQKNDINEIMDKLEFYRLKAKEYEDLLLIEVNK